jgi:hypothetical protein
MGCKLAYKKQIFVVFFFTHYYIIVHSGYDSKIMWFYSNICYQVILDVENGFNAGNTKMDVMYVYDIEKKRK